MSTSDGLSFRRGSQQKGGLVMSNVKISDFGRFIDRSISLFLVSLGMIVAGATAIAGV
jgi:hypothetical protein